MANILYSLILPPLIWLLFGAPSLLHASTLGILALPLLHLWLVIWQGQVFRLLKGDRFTYGSVSRAINILAVAFSLVIARLALFTYGAASDSLSSVPAYFWGAWMLALVVSLSLPILASRQLEPLASDADRRSFENPCDSK
jgi:hypothetical protein